MTRFLRVLVISAVCCFTLFSCGSISLVREKTSEYDPHKSFESEDAVYNEEALIEILRCFDERDKESLKNMFSPYKHEIYDLDQQIERAFAAYEGVSVSYGDFFDYGSMTKTVKDGKCTEKTVGAELKKIVTDKGKTYIICFGKCIVNDEDENKLGVTHITLRDENFDFLEAIGDDRYYNTVIVG